MERRNRAPASQMDIVMTMRVYGRAAGRDASASVVYVAKWALCLVAESCVTAWGVIGLLFFTTAFLLFLSAATAWSIPDHLWRQSDPQEAGTSDAAKAAAEVRPAAAKSE